VLDLLRIIGGRCGRIVIIGCEPASTEESMEFSAAVAAPVGPALEMVRDYATRMTAGGGEAPRALCA
jgi:hydrogenase maturation protease